MTKVTAEPTWDVATLNTFVSQQEDVLAGPLTKIGNSNGKTTLELDTLAGTPAKHAMITAGRPPATATIINSDKIYISSVLTQATAYRPT
jgi:hypothetical protein